MPDTILGTGDSNSEQKQEILPGGLTPSPTLLMLPGHLIPPSVIGGLLLLGFAHIHTPGEVTPAAEIVWFLRITAHCSFPTSSPAARAQQLQHPLPRTPRHRGRRALTPSPLFSSPFLGPSSRMCFPSIYLDGGHPVLSPHSCIGFPLSL